MRFSTVVVAAAAVASAAAVPVSDTKTPVDTVQWDGVPADREVPVDLSVEKAIEKRAGETVQWDGVPADREVPVDLSVEKAIEKRAIPVVVIAAGSAIGSAALGDLTTRAINAAVALIGDISNWTTAREGFTRTTTAEMWKKNPNYNHWKAAVCYNKGYSLKDRNNVSGFKDAKFKLGSLHTDYDCMYLGKGNAFYTHSDGGYINLSYTYARGACHFDGKTGDLTC
ncbi:hypothetical protein MPH_09382 [Macrophomina phaseolina MS6]|uniref:DUF7888 domain-containing protein n=2 Tax=Macrophomina phaseolina TaxID=35725 RepID=K2RFV9_MACPH|nr:hypothetical protein MPH_09382 [Macrophomina phaseolina MS6]KAH7043241.1 hypothetical protein B0J12DRAFT_730516 [Macrophomina phaseolina]